MLDEWQREWDALPRREKVRRQLASAFQQGRWLVTGKYWTDEELARYPVLGEMQREWDALPRRERMRERLAAASKSGADVWGRIAIGGVILFAAFLVVVGPIVKFLVPGGSDWLQRNTGTVMLLLFAPLILGIALPFIAGWVMLPFWLSRGLWRRLRS